MALGSGEASDSWESGESAIASGEGSVRVWRGFRLLGVWRIGDRVWGGGAVFGGVFSLSVFGLSVFGDFFSGGFLFGKGSGGFF
ncbi:hypothetical protein [Sodalinema gerasimenkoae]|uniref:hypothetical protein n=1 Tax=Sodalinema gerasimenkoae TaxID=2862348 RepID=UPI001358D635|nr:hypothetical protein [Sodalinema gerasimenkoae]